MASPTIESLCCLTTNNPFSQDILVDFHNVSYNVVSIIASLFGIGGAIYQVLPREPVSGVGTHGSQLFRTRGRVIIKWLAVADLMAAIGILIRSTVWVTGKTLGSPLGSDSASRVFCILSSGWIHYFYTATYFWTCVYALDVKLVLEERKIKQQIYHITCWICPALLCLTGLMTLYLPDLDCHETKHPFLRFLPNYLSTFVPIVAVMIANPFLYLVAFSRVERLLASSRGRFTHPERRVVQGLKMKFFLINLVFYVCWLPNVINGLTLWLSWDILPKTFLVVMWYLMAILNPLQAVFNSIVYRSWETTSYVRLPHWLSRIIPARYLSPGRDISPRHSSFDELSPNVGITQSDGGTDYFWQKLFRVPQSAEKTPLLFSGGSRVPGEEPETDDDEIDVAAKYYRNK